MRRDQILSRTGEQKKKKSVIVIIYFPSVLQKPKLGIRASTVAHYPATLARTRNSVSSRNFFDSIIKRQKLIGELNYSWPRRTSSILGKIFYFSFPGLLFHFHFFFFFYPLTSRHPSGQGCVSGFKKIRSCVYSSMFFLFSLIRFLIWSSFFFFIYFFF